MYIFELIAKLIKSDKKKEAEENKIAEYFDEETLLFPQEDESKCEHVFLPIDSTKKILACSKCGKLLKIKGEIPKKKRNFFNEK